MVDTEEYHGRQVLEFSRVRGVFLLKHRRNLTVWLDIGDLRVRALAFCVLVCCGVQYPLTVFVYQHFSPELRHVLSIYIAKLTAPPYRSLPFQFACRPNSSNPLRSFIYCTLTYTTLYFASVFSPHSSFVWFLFCIFSVNAH